MIRDNDNDDDDDALQPRTVIKNLLRRLHLFVHTRKTRQPQQNHQHHHNQPASEHRHCRLTQQKLIIAHRHATLMRFVVISPDSHALPRARARSHYSHALALARHQRVRRQAWIPRHTRHTTKVPASVRTGRHTRIVSIYTVCVCVYDITPD